VLGDWYTALLEQAATETSSRASVLSLAIVDRLKPYLQLRHFFRHAYSFDLRWPKMRSLVADLEPTSREVEQALWDYLES